MVQSAHDQLNTIFQDALCLGYEEAGRLYEDVVKALAVPTPAGFPPEIRSLATTLGKVSSSCQTVCGQLDTTANTLIPQAWQGDTATQAGQVIRNLSADLKNLPEAFATVVSSLNSWADQLYNIMSTQVNPAISTLWEVRTFLESIGATSPDWRPQDRSDGAQTHFIQVALLPAQEAIGQLRGAAQLVQDDGHALVNTLLGTADNAGQPSAAAAFAGLKAPAPAALTGSPSQAAAQAAADVTALQNVHVPPTADERAKIADLQRLLGEYDTDPIFSTTLLQQLGPDGLLKLTDSLARANSLDTSTGANPNSDRTLVTQLGQIEAGLGMTLATATNGADTVQLDPAFKQSLLNQDLGLKKYGEYNGYQVLGVLLHSPGAQFDGNFIDDYVTQLRRVEQGNNGSVWQKSGIYNTHDYPLNDIDNIGDGSDPMMGAMLAAGRDQSVATHLLDPSQNDNLRYLLTQRQWTNGGESGVDQPAFSGPYAALGQALDAATTDTGNPTSRDIMAHVVWAVGGTTAEGGLGNKVPDGMAPALTDMLSHYIVSGDVNATYDTAAAGSTLLSMPIPTGDPGHAADNLWNTHVGEIPPGGFVPGTPVGTPRPLASLLSQLGANPDSYNKLYGAETVYAGISLHDMASTAASQHAPVSSEAWQHVRTSAETSATVMGTLTHAQVTSIQPVQQDPGAGQQLLVTGAKKAADWGIDKTVGNVPVIGQPLSSYIQGKADDWIDGLGHPSPDGPVQAAVTAREDLYDANMNGLGQTIQSALGADPQSQYLSPDQYDLLFGNGLRTAFDSGYNGQNLGPDQPKDSLNGSG